MMYGESYDKMSDKDKMYRAHEDCQTLVEAMTIKMDKGRYKMAMTKAKEKMEALEYVTMNPGEMGKMTYPEYSKARKSRSKSMNGGTNHYA